MRRVDRHSICKGALVYWSASTIYITTTCCHTRNASTHDNKYSLWHSDCHLMIVRQEASQCAG